MSFVVNEDDIVALPHEARELYLPKQVPRLSSPPSPIVFLQKYVMPNLPVVIEGGVYHWPALKKWTKHYLREMLGEKMVTVTTTPNGYADAPVGDKFVLPDEQVMPFKEFLFKLDSNIDEEVVYIQKQNSSFTDEFSELMPDAEPHIPWASKAFGKLPDAVNFWMGSKRSITSMHKDHYENMYAVVSGSKTFILHPPSDLPCIPYQLYKVGRYKKDDDGKYFIGKEIDEQHGENNENINDVVIVNETCNGLESTNICNNDDLILKNDKSCSDVDLTSLCKNQAQSSINTKNNEIFNAEETKEDDINGLDNDSFSSNSPPAVPWISIDPLNPNYEKYPLYRHANQLRVTVNPGDLFYLPSLWFHHVQQTDDTIAVNFWYDMEYDIKYNYYKFVENIVHKNMKSAGE